MRLTFSSVGERHEDRQQSSHSGLAHNLTVAVEGVDTNSTLAHVHKTLQYIISTFDLLYSDADGDG